MKNSLLLFCLATLIACGRDDDPGVENQPENINTVKVVMMPAGGITDAVFLYQDTTAGTDPLLKTDTLFVNSSYQVKVYFLNEQVNPVDSLNSEIRQEATEHQVFLEFDPQMGISTSYLDVDANGNPLGLDMQVVTDTAIGTTEMTLTLLHKPLKFEENVSEGDMTHAGGTTDIAVSWDVYIQ